MHPQSAAAVTIGSTVHVNNENLQLTARIIQPEPVKLMSIIVDHLLDNWSYHQQQKIYKLRFRKVLSKNYCRIHKPSSLHSLTKTSQNIIRHCRLTVELKSRLENISTQAVLMQIQTSFLYDPITCSHTEYANINCSLHNGGYGLVSLCSTIEEYHLNVI